MKIGNKITLAALGAMAVAVVVGIVVQRVIIRKQGVDLTLVSMRSAITEAENVRESIAQLNRNNAFDRERLLAEYKASGDLRSSAIYDTIPVVAAWEAIAKAAEEQGFTFRIPKRQARNPKNLPTTAEEVILDALADGKSTEYVQLDKAANQLIYARPIKLSQDCLACHGDPATSPTKDGKDILGFPMENWRAGQVHGAFLLKADLGRVDAAVAQGMGQSIAWTLPCAALVALGFYFFNRTKIVRPMSQLISAVRHASRETEAASTEIANASQGLATGAGEQAASLEESSATLEEISGLTKRNADAAGSAQTVAGETLRSAEAGEGSMQQLNRAMAEIKASSDQIAKILKTIDEIAFQTNILALNAAVEAARAGEAGMGFSVVADEVRALAQRCATAARETSRNIDDSIERTDKGVALCQQVEASLGQIVAKARNMDQLAGELAVSAREQAQGVAQVNNAVVEMDRVTQANAAHAQETASASTQLATQAVELNRAVDGLFALVGDAGTSSQEPTTQPGPRSQPEFVAEAPLPVRVAPSKPVTPPARRRARNLIVSN